jgi:hypothetical protein
MASYYGLMLDAGGTIRAIRTIKCVNDVAAVETARGALLRSPRYEAAEVWRHGERVGKVLRTRSGAGQDLDPRQQS